MLSVDEALSAILKHVEPSTAEPTPMPSAMSRVLAQDVTTPHGSPPFDKSMMDGFAVRSADFFNTSGDMMLSVVETITAGTVPVRTIETGTAAQIMTGAPLPQGADCVVPIERVHLDAARPGIVTVSSVDVSAERHVLRAGCLAETGARLLSAGTLIEPQHIAVLAEFGLSRIPTHRCPEVAVLATGDELVPFDQPLSPGKIRNSNEPMLVSQVQRACGIAVPLGVARDNREELRTAIQRGLQSDFLLLSGGVSAGTLDLVPSELQAAGVTEVFHKISMKPGKPLWFGERKTLEHRCHVFGLPGNPVSSMICFEAFVRPALRRFAGHRHPESAVVSATLVEDVAVRGDRVTYYPSQLVHGQHGFEVRPVPWGGSADLRSTAQANSMSILEPRNETYAAGETVSVIAWT
ncbi:MAG: molybdopterin molybdotransferase MoeA [Planctomycetaceae bacterium]